MYNFKIGDNVIIRTHDNIKYSGKITDILPRLDVIVIDDMDIVSCNNIKLLLRREMLECTM